MTTRNLSDRYHDDPVLGNQLDLDEGLNGACKKIPSLVVSQADPQSSDCAVIRFPG